MQSSKFVIEDIVLSEQEMQELKSKLINHTNKSYIIRKAAGGNCTSCLGIPTKKVLYDVGDGKLVDYYCDLCWQKHKSGLNKRLKGMDFT
jgi:hypothetical protein